jgi:hypothetical protein
MRANTATVDQQHDSVSLRTLQRRARAAGSGRFAWDDIKDDDLRNLWLTADIDALAELIGCKPRTLYDRAAELGLAPRDPVCRAIASGETPRAPLRLPTADELLRASRAAAGLAARGLPEGIPGRPQHFERA